MSALCILAGGKTVTLAVSLFSLGWTHSVQKTGWREEWRITPAGLVLETAMIRGSGAGMEPGEGAVARDGWLVWHPRTKPLPSLALAASGATGGGWQLCHDGGCLQLGSRAGEDTVLSVCDDD
ncbi:DUF1850 domain-containing protein [Rhizobiaceae bacterium BDR2-2]|uniref:DUF1850 domain-containing protein n=1 Tax=Ectorhizobium quercum TaxID=2965071 RepID=A0AAE3MZ61_9HYPH|nr:DUF1850 domain-containing protein [Ectorhizobium quercum]MCX8996360.1 DUF1850 domain-containing protein [Ectorhizobium quercum]MCX8998601.1 DUF1850 domain-containing protein [Ectorhizobium quercum]